ncbi:MAG: hypothetical protein PWP71_2457 [Clostridia bacterium]|nr:hypothetical protein [Clostridia bacterium]
MATNRVVQDQSPHKHIMGDCMDNKKKYDATYKIGNTTVHVVAPPPMTKEEIDKVLKEFHQAGWNIWNSLTPEEQMKINKEYLEQKKKSPSA